VEPVYVVTESTGQKELTPDLSDLIIPVTARYINHRIGTKLEVADMVSLVGKMGMPASFSSDEEDGMIVSVPVTRSDVLHACDIAEDVAIGFGYNNITTSMPKSATIGREQPINKLSDQMRESFSQAGYTEALTWVLSSEEDNFDNLQLPRPPATKYVGLSNPATEEFTMMRNSLFPGLLKVVHENNGQHPLPFRIFEVSDVVIVASETLTGTRNNRKMAAVFAGLSPGFEEMHGLLDRIMQLNGIDWVEEKDKKSKEESKEAKKPGYYLTPSSSPSFVRGQQASVFLGNTDIGTLGVFSPEVPAAFKIHNLVLSGFEIDLEPFCELK